MTHRFPKGSSGPFGSDLAGEWRSSEEILEECDAIFRRNRRLTESLLWKYAPIRKHARAFLEWTANIPVPGWYDTHVRHDTYKPGLAA